jgi:hypothetical protein
VIEKEKVEKLIMKGADDKKISYVWRLLGRWINILHS